MSNSICEVAIVDDDPSVRESLKFLLEIEGYGVATYDSALTYLDDPLARPLCMIVDHHMPGMTGLELIARIRRNGVRLPILILTGGATPEIRAVASKLDVQLVLDKPASDGDLLGFIANNVRP